MSSTSSGTDGPARWRIRLRGRLDPRWAARFEPLTLTSTDGCTVLEGPLADQAALHGLLHRLRDTGLPLVSVTEVPQNPCAQGEPT